LHASDENLRGWGIRQGGEYNNPGGLDRVENTITQGDRVENTITQGD
jgi:hypothetical protein